MSAVRITVELEDDVAWQLAQFCKRSTFTDFYNLTEAHLDPEDRKVLAYKMIRGIELVQAALRDQGVAPR